MIATTCSTCRSTATPPTSIPLSPVSPRSAAGEGFNLNLPMPHGASDAVFFEQLERALKAVKDFSADVLVLSLGFDIYELDPQSKVAATRDGFARLDECIRGLGLPCVIVQEGGYHLETLDSNAQAFFCGPQTWAK